ncbi:hypothetical protein DPMN_009568 [Dreissena polymorpha]|uniref:Uncharacterized protein n=1 Tax=Dreissena polymorpha TaxID=45954 RepID=A0A9D4MX74_DREPO|nr:hypothetical protein DPMN_009568 [Dreissena polymorpha]
MLLGLGGNNGSTVTAAILANKHRLSWHTKEGLQHANYLVSRKSLLTENQYKAERVVLN